MPNNGYLEPVHFAYSVAAAQFVPEPETWAMLLTGLGIVGAITRRQRKQPSKEAARPESS
jgi:hypothetical protein